MTQRISCMTLHPLWIPAGEPGRSATPARMRGLVRAATAAAVAMLMLLVAVVVIAVALFSWLLQVHGITLVT